MEIFAHHSALSSALLAAVTLDVVMFPTFSSLFTFVDDIAITRNKCGLLSNCYHRL